MNAFDRGQQLFTTQAKDIPLLAMRYQFVLISKLGMCGEVMLTALCWFAEQEEQLPPSGDDLYDLNKVDPLVLNTIKEANESTWKPEWWDSLNN